MNILNFLHKNVLISNTCWEDPRIDRQALDLNDKSNVLVITSAGCNALDYLIAGNCSVQSVDMNLRQNALLDLKVAAARTLEYSQYFDLFGHGKINNPSGIYQKISPYLSHQSRSVWDNLFAKYFGSKISFYFRGSSGFFARLVNFYIDQKPKLKEGIDKLLHASTLEEQRKIFHSEVEPIFWNKQLKWLLSRRQILALVGVPEAQKRYVEQFHSGGVPGFIEDCLKRVFTTISIKDNYFWRVYLTGSYTQDCCPLYLTEYGYRTIKEDGWMRLKSFTGTISECLESFPERYYSHFVLLDHMDWLYENKKNELTREWELIEKQSIKPARIIWRSGGKETDFVTKISLGKTFLGDRLTFLPSNYSGDRVNTYASFSVCDLI
mgnify:CR=1 FL=1